MLKVDHCQNLADIGENRRDFISKFWIKDDLPTSTVNCEISVRSEQSMI